MPITANPSVLVVDDVEDIRDLVTIVLRFEGYRVTAAEDGVDALRQVALDPPDLILLDLTMPEMSGFAVLAELKRSDATSAIPVVVVSGRTDDAALDGSLAAGAAGVILKPYDPVALVECVAGVLRQGHPERAGVE